MLLWEGFGTVPLSSVAILELFLASPSVAEDHLGSLWGTPPDGIPWLLCWIFMLAYSTRLRWCCWGVSEGPSFGCHWGVNEGRSSGWHLGVSEGPSFIILFNHRWHRYYLSGSERTWEQRQLRGSSTFRKLPCYHKRSLYRWMQCMSYSGHFDFEENKDNISIECLAFESENFSWR